MQEQYNALAWGNHVDEPFRARVLAICKEFDWTPDHADWLMACMAFESGRTFDPAVRNMAGSGAIGLIQFMPSTALGLGTTTQELARMTRLQQLEYVRRYFLPYFRRISSLSDMYMAILLPKYVGKPDDAVLFSGGIAYRQNSGLDTNKDGKITKAEAAGRVYAHLEQGRLPEYASQYSSWMLA